MRYVALQIDRPPPASAKDKDLRCCNRVFSKWINKKGTSTYPLTWMALCTLLIDMEYRDVAEELKEILRAKGVTL